MINLDNLNFSYPSTPPVLERFSLNVDRGSLFGLLGPNGAGKTTLISLITGLHTPQAGLIRINNMRFATQREAILRKIAVVPQEYAFYTQLTAYENLSFFSRLYPQLNKPTAQINKAIELTGLGTHQHRLAKHFSGGLKRRLNLAIGLLNQPELLILDEPTVGIDPQSRHFILKSIRALNEQGTTILYTSHYMEEVEQLCKSIAIMDHGKILASGDIGELLDSDSTITVYTRQHPNADELGPDLAGYLREHRLTIRNNCISGDLGSIERLADLIRLLRKRNFIVERIDYGRQTLESLFFHLTHADLREI